MIESSCQRHRRPATRAANFSADTMPIPPGDVGSLLIDELGVVVLAAASVGVDLRDDHVDLLLLGEEAAGSYAPGDLGAADPRARGAGEVRTIRIA